MSGAGAYVVTPTPIVHAIKPRGFFDNVYNVRMLNIVTYVLTFFALILTIVLLTVPISIREEAARDRRSKRTAAYDELVTEWTGTHLPSLQATWTGANALAVPNVTVTRGAGANAGATGGRLTADTGGALVVETDTEDAIGRLPDPENDYLRYDSGLVLKARVMRFHDSRWATESDTFNVTVGDGDDAVSFDGIAAYTCDPAGSIRSYDDGGGSLTSNPLHLTRITIVMDEALSDGRFVADSTLPKCALEYSHISQVPWEIRYGPNKRYATYSEALAHAEGDAEGGCGTFRTPERDADLEIVIRSPRDPYVGAPAIAESHDPPWGIDGCAILDFGRSADELREEAFRLTYYGGVPCAVMLILFAAASWHLRKKVANMKAEERQNVAHFYAQTMQMQTQMQMHQMHQMQQGQPPPPQSPAAYYHQPR
jgi:hypothetical protein